MIPAFLFVACTSDEEESALNTTVLNIPLAVYEVPAATLSPTESRSTGDPGIYENLPAPKVLYVWIVEGDRIWFDKLTNLAGTTWTKRSDGGLTERWEYNHQFQLPDDVTLNNGATLQVYAIAAQHELTTSMLTGLTQTSTITLPNLQGATFDLSSWPSGDAATHSWALGNLYSTPLALMGNGNADATGFDPKLLHNGTYTVSKVGTTITINDPRPTRLYHCAAKADFKWEVATTLQPTVSVSTITITGLPTHLKVFEPTHNLVGSGSCPLLATSDAVNTLTPGNKWIGREYAYVLQPPTTTSTGDGNLTYSVTFTGRTPDEKNHPAAQTTSPATNPVFTTWYRINADINN